MHRNSESPPSGIRTPLVRRSLGIDVYRAIWDRLVNRELAPGERLSDLYLSREFGVSRTPVREALHRLVQEGVVMYYPNRGFFVAKFCASDVAEIFDLRAALETLALRTMMGRLRTIDIDEQEHVHESVATAVATARASNEGDANDVAAAFFEIDQGFHQWLIRESGNQRLIAIANGLWGQIAVFQRAGTHAPGWVDIALQQHREILHHMLAGELHAAENALAHHILDMKTRILADNAPGLITNKSTTSNLSS